MDAKTIADSDVTLLSQARIEPETVRFKGRLLDHSVSLERLPLVNKQTLFYWFAARHY